MMTTKREERIVTARARFFSGHGIETLPCLVTADAVLPYDGIAGHFTRNHSIRPSAERRNRRMAKARKEL